MDLSNLMIMRNELSLTVILLILLLAEIFSSRTKERHHINDLAAFLFLLHTFLGFIRPNYGELFGGMYVADELTAMMKTVLNVGVFIVILQAGEWLKKPENKNRISEYYMLMFSTLIGMYFMISAGHFLMLYIGLELATIPMAALAAYDLYKMKSTEAGIKLILLAAVASGLLLFGLSLIYGSTGSMYYTEIGPLMSMNSLQVLALAFLIGGLGFKISLVPFHLWTADTYEGAPTNVAAYLSVVSKGASVFVLTILLFTVFKNMFPAWEIIIYILIILTMTVGNLFAIRQQNLQRFLAFSSVAQAGFILLGILAGTTYGMASVLYFVWIYAFSNLGAFAVVSIVKNMTGKVNIRDYDGFYDTNPKMSLVMLLSLFSLAGIPPVAGFFGKFFLFTAAAEQGYYILVLIAVINTIVSLYYYLLVVKAMFINKSENPIPDLKGDMLARVAMGLSALGIIAIGFFGGIFDWIMTFSFGM